MVIVTSIILFCSLYLKIRLLTSLALGSLIGTVLAGLTLQFTSSSGDFDSPNLAARRNLYAFFAACTTILLLLHLLAAVYREARRRRPLKCPPPPSSNSGTSASPPSAKAN